MKILKHIVMWKFLDNAEGKTKAENMRFAAENLRALVGVAPKALIWLLLPTSKALRICLRTAIFPVMRRYQIISAV